MRRLVLFLWPLSAVSLLNAWTAGPSFSQRVGFSCRIYGSTDQSIGIIGSVFVVWWCVGQEVLRSYHMACNMGHKEGASAGCLCYVLPALFMLVNG